MPKKKKKNSKLRKIINKIKKNKVKFSLKEVIVIVIVAIALGIILGGIITYSKESLTISQVPSELEEFVTTFNNISDNYYKKVDKKKLVDAAIEGMINSLDDPYSNYFDEKNTDSFNQTVDGEYVGIGVSISVDEKTKVEEVFENSPAKKAGIKVNDVIVEIDGKSIKDKKMSEIRELILGKKGSSVSITIVRNDKEIKFNIKRQKVEIQSVSSKIINENNKKVGYIKIDVFAANTYNQFKKNLEKIEKKNIDSLIIDVRDNSGGHLNQVTKILELFMDKKKVLYQIKDQKTTTKVYSRTKEKRSYKIAVLINKYSASASEILASAMKESYKGEIVGITSYGKGTVQRAYELSDGTSLKYTTQKWLTPKGNWINKKGVTPTKEVEQDEGYYIDPIDENDTQLNEAIKLLVK